MQSKDRQKMCSHCDGRIPFEADQCPYCAVVQESPFVSGNAQALHHQSLQDSLTSLYPPPYAAKQAPLKTPEPLKETMAEKRFNNSSAPLGIPTIPTDMGETTHMDDSKSSFWPILLLSLGANLLTIGLLQLFFSDNGFLRLEWNSGYWFVYCLAAVPLFFFGFKKANSIK